MQSLWNLVFSIETAFAQASQLSGKGREAADKSRGAISELFSILWDKMDNWIAALVVVGFSLYLANLFKRMVVNRIAEHIDEEHQDVLVLAGRATYVAVFGIGVTIGLKVGGIDITAIVAAIGFGIGFAMKDLIMNFMAGVMLLLARNYTIGDYIQINDTIGQIVEIQGRATILKALNGTKVIVPNADLFTNQVTSFTSNPFRRIEFEVGVEYDTDLHLAVQTAFQVLGNNENVIKEPEPAVLVHEFGESSINFYIRFWVDSKNNWWEIQSKVMIDLKAALDAVNINIPFPIRTLHFKNEKEKELAKQIARNSFQQKTEQNESVFQEELQSSEPTVQPVAATITSEGQEVEGPIRSVPEAQIQEENEKIPKDSGAAFLRGSQSELQKDL